MGRLHIMEKAGVETHPKNTQLETVNYGRKEREKKKKKEAKLKDYYCLRSCVL